MPNSVSRRRFLKSAAAGGAALGVTARGWAAEQAPNLKLVVGVMGMGGRGTGLAQQFQQQPNTEVAYVCGVDRRRLAAAVGAVGRQPRRPGNGGARQGRRRPGIGRSDRPGRGAALAGTRTR